MAERESPGMVETAAFGCEIALLVTLAVAGAGLGSSTFLHIVLSVLFPVLAAGVWGVLMAPNSSTRLVDPLRLIAQVILFLAAGVLVAAAGRLWWGVVFTVVSVLVFALSRRTGGVTGS